MSPTDCYLHHPLSARVDSDLTKPGPHSIRNTKRHLGKRALEKLGIELIVQPLQFPNGRCISATLPPHTSLASWLQVAINAKRHNFPLSNLPGRSVFRVDEFDYCSKCAVAAVCVTTVYSELTRPADTHHDSLILVYYYGPANAKPT